MSKPQPARKLTPLLRDFLSLRAELHEGRATVTRWLAENELRPSLRLRTIIERHDAAKVADILSGTVGMKTGQQIVPCQGGGVIVV